MRSIAAVVMMVLVSYAAVGQSFDFSNVDRLLQDSLRVLGGVASQDQGGVALLIWKDGKLIYDRSYALPGKTFSKSKLIPIASASKWMSGAVITAMLERGELTLDDNVATYITTAPSDKRGLSVRQLFSFTSGLQGNLGGPTACLDDAASKITLAACVDSVLTQPLVAAPGAMFNYGSDGMQVAGRMAEVASGLALPSGTCWDTLFKRNVALPLGLMRTGWDVPFLYDTDNPRIDGGVLSTAEEYLLLVRMVLGRGTIDGKRVIAEAFIDSMLADQTRGAAIGYTPYLGMERLRPGIKNTRYGIGVWRERIDSATGRALEVSSQGKFGFSPWVDFERGYCAVLAVKSDLSPMYPTYLLLKDRIREAIDAVTSVDDDAPPLDENWITVGYYDVLGRRVEALRSGLVFHVETNGHSIRSSAAAYP